MRPQQFIFASIAFLIALPANAQDAQSLFRLASAHYQRGEWAEASEFFKKVLTEPQAFQFAPDALFYLAEAHVQSRQWSQAQEAYAQFLKRYPQHALIGVANFRQVEIAFLSHQPNAIRMAESYLQESNDSAWKPITLRLLGERRLENQEPQLAGKVFETALNDFPGHPLSDEFRVGLANSRIAMNQSIEARAVLQPLVEKRNDGLGQRARLLLAICDSLDKDWDSACRKLSEIVDNKSLEPNRLGEAYLWLGRCESERQNWTAAVQAFRTAVGQASSKPREQQARVEYAQALIHNEQFDEAIGELKSFCQEESATPLHDLALAMLTRTAYSVNKFDEADKFARQYLQRFPQGSNLQLVNEIMGRISYNQGDFQHAAEIFTSLVNSPYPGLQQATVWNYLLAISLIGSERSPEALSVLRNVEAAQLPSDIREEFHWVLSKSEAAAGNLAAAKTGFEGFKSSYPESRRLSNVDIELGWLALRLEDFVALQQLWPKLMALEKSDPWPSQFWQLSGDLAFRQSDWALAIDCYRKLADPTNEVRWQAIGWSGLAWTALEQRELIEARRNFERLTTFPNDLATVREGYLPLADLFDRDHEWNQAAKYYELAANLSEKPNLKQVANLKRAIALQKLNDREQLQTSLELLAELDGQLPLTVPADQVLYRWAWAAQELGQSAEAQRLLERFLQEQPASDLWPDAAFRVAQYSFQANANRETAELLDQSLARNPPIELTSRIQFLQAQIAARKKDWKEVARLTQAVIDSSPETHLRRRAQYWLAESHFQTNQFEDALRIYQSWGDGALDLEMTLQPWANLRLAQSLAATEQFEEALKACERALNSLVDFAPSYEFELVRGRCLFALGKITDAIQAYKSVISNPAAGNTESSAQAQWRIGEAHFHREDYKAAIEAFYLTESSYAYPHWRAAALLEAGKCQERLGNWKHALKLYRELIQLFPASEFASPAKERILLVERRAELQESSRR